MLYYKIAPCKGWLQYSRKVFNKKLLSWILNDVTMPPFIRCSVVTDHEVIRWIEENCLTLFVLLFSGIEEISNLTKNFQQYLHESGTCNIFLGFSSEEKQQSDLSRHTTSKRRYMDVVLTFWRCISTSR